MSITPTSLQGRAERATRHHHTTSVDEAPTRRLRVNAAPENDVPEDALAVFETLCDQVGHQTARQVLHLLDGYAPKLFTIDKLMARRRLPDLMAKRPDLSTRAVARLLGVSHATVQRWLGETGTASGTRSTEGR